MKRRGYWRSHPIVFTIATIVGVLAGFLGSIYSTQIQRAFPFYWGPSGPISPHAAAFWLSLVATAVLFLVYQWGRDIRETEAEERLLERTRQLELSLQTLPPQGFLIEFSKNYSNCYVAASGVLNAATPPPKALCEEAARLILWSIAVLTRTFDGKPGARYGCNIMLFKNVSSAAEAEVTGLKSQLRFAEKEIDLRTVRGVLEMQLQLSAATDGEPREADNKLGPLVLPIVEPAKTDDTRRWRLLPGAPIAFVDKTLVTFQNTSTMGEYCRDRCNFPPTTVTELDQYFGSEEAKLVRSFASFPLMHNADVIGVVNVHSDSPGILRQTQTPDIFLPLMRPFTILLADLIIATNP